MNSLIPKRIIQTDKSINLPPISRGTVANIRLLNPDFEYLFFDDMQVEEFIKSFYPEYLNIFNSFPFRIQKYDFFRYLVIYRYGGFYFDMDILLTQKLDSLVAFGCVFPFERLTWSDYLRVKHKMEWEIGNYAFGATVGHPFVNAIIKNCIRAQTDHEWREEILRPFSSILRQELFVIYTTGPGLVTRTLAEYINTSKPVKILFPKNICDKNNWNQFGEYGVHLMHSSWRSQHGFLRKKLINFLAWRNEKRAIKLALKFYKSRTLDNNNE